VSRPASDVLGASPQTGGAVLPLIEALLEAFAARGVSYCHWKSNDRIDRSLSGENDLDLLVERSHAGRLLEAATGLGFKRAVTRVDREFPTLEDWYGLDRESQRFVHLHVHYQLVLGEPLIKNHRLPVERAMLATRRHEGPLPVAHPAAELAVLVLRAVLKERAIGLLRPSGRRRLSQGTRRELDFLLGRTRPEEARAFVAAHLPGFPPALFDEALDLLANEAPLAARFRMRRRVLAALAPHRRRGRAGAAAAFLLRRLFVVYALRVEGHPPRKTPASGGYAVAVLGSDGSGKSTAIGDLSRWLSPIFDVRTAHLGKPPRSLGSRLVDRTATALRRITGHRENESWVLPGDVKDAPAWLQALQAFQFALLARDRYREYRRVRRWVARGMVVLCDRYPRPDLALMESAIVHTLPLAASGRLQRAVRAEQDYYARIGPPDLTLVLRVTPEIAAQRTGDSPEFVARRAREICVFADGRPADAVVVDADRPLEEVQRALRTAVWAAL
jgi:thymidylate kinase